MSQFKENISSLKEVARLEGWDASLVELREKQHSETQSDVTRERIELGFHRAFEAAAEYLRIRRKRSDEFWEICKKQNETSMREYIDLRRLAKTIQQVAFPKDKVKSVKVKSAGPDDSDESEV